MEKECCSNEKCCCSCHSKQDESCQSGDKQDEMWKSLLEAADCAWMEVLKDKLKENILSTEGGRMEELAKIVSEANKQRWKHKMEKKQGGMDFKEKLSRFFGQNKK